MYMVTIQKGAYDNHPFYGENLDYGYREIALFDFLSRAIEFVHSEKNKFAGYEELYELVIHDERVIYCMVLVDDSVDGSFVDFTIRRVENGTIITTGEEV